MFPCKYPRVHMTTHKDPKYFLVNTYDLYLFRKRYLTHIV